MTFMNNLRGLVSIRQWTDALDISRATLYRLVNPPEKKPAKPRKKSPRALTTSEVQTVKDTLHSPRFLDASPPQAWSTLLEEDKYLCSVRTMYRILSSLGESKERRQQRRHNYAKPELLATAPNQVWSWDITLLKGPVKWTYYYLYVLLDIFSRYVVGWMVAPRQNGTYARQLIEQSILNQLHRARISSTAFTI